MSKQLSEERNIGFESVATIFADDVLSVELTPGLIRIALGETRSDHRGERIVRNSVPVVQLVLPNDAAMNLAEILTVAAQKMEVVAQPGSRMSIVPPKPANH